MQYKGEGEAVFTQTKTFIASKSELQNVIRWVDSLLARYDCPADVQEQLNSAVKEIFIDVTGFADLQETNSIDITCHFSGSPAKPEITFADRGIPYDPMKKKKPANGEADERSIFMLKESMDDIKYHCENGQNILTITKTLQPAE